MMKNIRPFGWIIFSVLFLTVLMTGCNVTENPGFVEPESTAIPTFPPNLPKIKAVELDRTEVPNYESIEFTLSVEAEYSNPYDAREIRLDGTFTAPDGIDITVPGFWDGASSWRLRFTPSQEGDWRYQLFITDGNGTSLPSEGDFKVTASNLHGWLQVGDWINPDYSSQYLVHQDGTPFYGVGHCDALNILIDGFDPEDGVVLFNNMLAADENFVVWWPLYSNSPVSNHYESYTASNLTMIDLIVQDAQKKGIFLIFTIWDHPQLRDSSHAWGDGRWDGFNGFHKLTSIDEFFTSEEAWVWQENFYRYIIARWGHSPAIGMWQTVSEINGTNAYEQMDSWHAKINAYFVENDPYRHPTTASMSGDVDWPGGHAEMDAPQVHVYALDEGATAAARTIASWTELMWQTGKPNWIGEFGVTGNSEYPEMFHNAIWAALGAGAALTPAEWNSGGSWMQMTTEMSADQARLAQFVKDIPLAWLNPVVLEISSSDPDVRSWGVAGQDGGLLWVQDFSTEGQPIEDLRASEMIRTGVELQIQGLADGTFTITPYHTWQGAYLEPFEVACPQAGTCLIPLPEFENDMAFKIERK